MGTVVDAESRNDPYDNLFMEINQNRLTRGAPLLLQSSFANKLSINMPGSLGEFRLGVVSDGQPIYLEPGTDTWVKPVAGKLKWTITPGSTEERFTLVLYSRDFNQTLEFHCESYAADHPWYSSSRFYVFTPTNNGFFAHKGILRLTQTDYRNGIQLLPVGNRLFGKKITMTLTGEHGVPDVTPAEPQTMGHLELKWNFSFDKFDKVVPVTARFEAEGVPLGTSFDFSPTADVMTETVSGKLEHSEAIESSTDSAKE